MEGTEETVCFNWGLGFAAVTDVRIWVDDIGVVSEVTVILGSYFGLLSSSFHFVALPSLQGASRFWTRIAVSTSTLMSAFLLVGNKG